MSPRIDSLIDRASVEELVALVAGTDFWHTAAIERLGIPAMRVSDGPVGARGTRFDGEASICAPCSTLLAATWDVELVERVGELLGRETKAKGASVLLAPTVNLHRTPVGGRNFECMSEDPYLTARTAVAYVRGLQSEGVASCIKHFIGNDTEFERNTIDSRIDERTLREVYLRPFEATIRDAGVMAVMTSYNRVNGVHAAESPLVADVLRGEWGFDGLVMSDWFGLHSTVEGVKAGLDLEMPGPTLHRGEKLLQAVDAGSVTTDELRVLARRVLELLERTGALDAAGPGEETTRHDPADIALVRRAAAEGFVLLQNRAAPGTTAPALPLRAEGLRRVALIGPNAAVGEVMGGGSAHVTPTAVVTPLDAIREYFEALGVEVVHAPGCQIHRRLPELDLRRCTSVTVDVYDDPAELDDPTAVPVRSAGTGTTRLLWQSDPTGRGAADPQFGVRVRAAFVPDVSGAWKFGIESVAPARIVVDGVVVADNSDAPVGGSFFGYGRDELVADVAMDAGHSYDLVVELRHHATGQGMGGLNIGALAPVLGDLMDDAIEAAGSADLSIVVVGTNDNWESEGWDRTDLALPGRQNELIERVADASHATVVILNAGSPVAMPWLADVESVLVAWFPGQEMGNALVDVLTGAVEPQGRLPVTFPARMEDTPAFEHHPGRKGVANYLEGRLLGHHWYSTVGRVPLFPFGHGIGYGCADIADVVAVSPHELALTLSNIGDRDAVEVVQVYAHLVDRELAGRDEPDQRLVGYSKFAVHAGEARRVHLTLDPDAYRRWDVAGGRWGHPSARYELRVGRSATDIAAAVEVTVGVTAEVTAEVTVEVRVDT
jgi:beta-glucosidase